MVLIAGTIIFNDNKILMVKEAKKECFGKWSYPAGHIEKNESIPDGAIRETLEETGCTVKLLKLFPKFIIEKQNIELIYFLAKPIKNDINHHTDEILETKWISIEDVKKMQRTDFRNFFIINEIIKCIKQNNLYELKNLDELPKKTIHE